MDLVGHKHLVAHPRVAHLLLRTSTDYPEALPRAIGEHHERMDGSGYPARLAGTNISTLGRMLAVVEVTLGILRAPVAPLTRASFALRVVPGEFDIQWIGLVCDMARDANESLTLNETSAAASSTPLEEIAMHSQNAKALEDNLKAQGRTGAILEVPALALQRLARLRVAWNALGLWGVQTADLTALEQFDAHMASRELQQHLRDLQRECMLLSEKFGVSERLLLAPLWQGLL
jgi:HD-GYP domain-containing protein (c-di-GMP phosphodiesterase class II)